MKIYYYVHTGHRIGLDRFRRATTIIRALGDYDITLLCSDYRIAQVAKDFGVEKSLGIDVVRNIPQIALHGDKIIFDSDEANPTMLNDMRQFFSSFIRISDNKDEVKEKGEFLVSPYLSGDEICNSYIVDDKYFDNSTNKVDISYFFGDDDYEKDLKTNLSLLDSISSKLQLGFYYFLDYENELKKEFKNYYEFEEYDEMIINTRILISASPQAILESLAGEHKPIFIKRKDYTSNFDELFKFLNIPIIKNYDNQELLNVISSIDDRKYTKIYKNSNTVKSFIENLFK